MVTSPCVGKSQCGFIEFVVQPVYMPLAEFVNRRSDTSGDGNGNTKAPGDMWLDEISSKYLLDH